MTSSSDEIMTMRNTTNQPTQTEAQSLPVASSRSGAELVEALRASPYRDIEINPKREPMPVRKSAP